MRSDVLVRHMRGCQRGSNDSARRLANKSKSRTKSKSACDECAKAKTKCDHQNPCDRCRQKSLKCEKTRTGYEDPYGIYRLPNTSSTDIEAEHSAHTDDTDADYGFVLPHLESPSRATTVHVSETARHEQDEAYFGLNQIEEQNNMALSCLPSPPNDKNSEACLNMQQFLVGCGLPDSAQGIISEPDPSSIYFASVEDLGYLFNNQSQFKPVQGSPLRLITAFDAKSWLRL